MHAKVAETYQIIQRLKRRHDEAAIVKYSDYEVLADDIQMADQIHRWFVKLKRRKRWRGSVESIEW